MRFAIPHILWFLMLVPFLGMFLIWAAGHRRKLFARFGSDKALLKHGIAAISMITWVRMTLVVFGMIALIVALARPQWGYHERQVISRGVDMVIAIDTSASMMARDFPPNRLSRAKELLRNLIWEARGDRVGIVAFAGSAVVMCPLTLDYNMAAVALKTVDVNTVAAKGTNIGSAIKAAIGAFEVSNANDRILVLLTDGEQLDQQDDLQEIVKKAAEVGIKIFSIGLGTSEGSTIPTARGPKRDSAGNIVHTSLDFETLQQISKATGGEAIRADEVGASEIAEISAALSKFRGHKQQDKTFRVYHDRYPWFVGAALLFFAVEALLASTRRLTMRKSTRLASKTGLAMMVLLLGQGHAWAYPGEDFVRSRDALQKYHAGDYDKSTALYEQASQLSPQNPQILFNLGAAAAKAGKPDEARKALGKVYDPENPILNANARFGAATLNHRAVRKTIAENKNKWPKAVAQGDEKATGEVKDAIDKLKEIIGEYKETILVKPNDIDMKANYELAKKDLQELENLLKQKQNQKEQQQQQQQPQKNQQENKDNKKQSEQKNNDSKSEKQQGEEGKDQQEQGQEQNENQNQKDKPEQKQGDQPEKKKDPKGEQQDEQKGENEQNQSGSDQPGDQKDQQPKPDPQGTPAPTPTPSPTGTPKPGDQDGKGGKPLEQGQPVPIGQMSPTDVDRLLNTLPPEDQQALQLLMGTPTEQPDMKHDW